MKQIPLGLLCFLLGIGKADQVARDPLVGSIFENLIVMECLKAQYNRGKMADRYFYRGTNGNEIDIVLQHGRKLIAIEIKSARTFAISQLESIKKLKKHQIKLANLIYYITVIQ